MKWIDGLLKIVRLDYVSQPNNRGEVTVIKNIGMRPDGTLIPMKPHTKIKH